MYSDLQYKLSDTKQKICFLYILHTPKTKQKKIKYRHNSKIYKEGEKDKCSCNTRCLQVVQINLLLSLNIQYVAQVGL